MLGGGGRRQGLRRAFGGSVVHAERLWRWRALPAAAQHFRRVFHLATCDGRFCCRVRYEAAQWQETGYINHDDAYGAWNLEAAQFQAKDNKVDLAVESVSPSIADVTAPMLKLRAANVDVLVIATYARPAQLVLKKAHEMGFNKPIVIAVNAIATCSSSSKTSAARTPSSRSTSRRSWRINPAAKSQVGLTILQGVVSRPRLETRPSAGRYALRIPSAMALVKACRTRPSRRVPR